MYTCIDWEQAFRSPAFREIKQRIKYYLDRDYKLQRQRERSRTMASDQGKVNEAKQEAKSGKTAPAIPPKRGVSDKMPLPEVRVVDDGKGKKKEPKPVKSGVKYVLLKNYSAEGGTKMPLQCQQILKILDEAEGKTLEKKDLLAKMSEVVQTRQPIERILAFYQPRLISGEFFKMEPIISAAPVAETPAAEKPATK